LIQNAADNYISLFHPSSLLKRQLLGVADELDKINDSMIILDGRDGELVVNTQPHSCYVSTLAQLVDAFPDTHHVKAHSQHFICSLSEYGHHGNTLSRLINDIWMVVMVPHQSVFMGRNNLEVIAILRQLAEHLHASLQQIRTTTLERFKMYEQKTLRSRQRVNLDRLLSHIGVYWSTVALALCLMCLVMATIPRSHDQPLHDMNKLTKFLKKCLRFGENFSSQTSPFKNRWDEAQCLCSNFISEICTQIISYIKSQQK
jgi:hypothetical protein